MALKPRPDAPAGDAPGKALPGPASGEAGVPRYDSRRLFGTAREIVIEHNTRDYRLRVTAQGKLILTA